MVTEGTDFSFATKKSIIVYPMKIVILHCENDEIQIYLFSSLIIKSSKVTSKPSSEFGDAL